MPYGRCRKKKEKHRSKGETLKTTSKNPGKNSVFFPAAEPLASAADSPFLPLIL
jgi:hypothetical protein